MTRLWGGTIIVLIIGGIIGLKRGELETLKPAWEIAILWFIMTSILNFAAFTYMPYSAADLVTHWIDTIVITALAVINIIFYYRAVK